MSPAFRISIGSNIALAGAIAAFLWHGHSGRVSPATHRASAPTGEPKAAGHIGAPRSGPEGAGLTRPAVAELEKMGISQQVLVSVLLEDLSHRSAKRVLDLQKRYAPKLVPAAEMRELVRQDDIEQVNELKAAFGEEGYLAWDKAETLRNLNRARIPGDDLPMTEEEADQAYRLQKEYDDKSKDLRMAMEDGVADKADVAALQARAQQALDDALQRLLGTQRFNELRGNTDPTTQVYRQYGDLNPTADQANAVVLAEQNYRAQEANLTKQLAQSPGDIASVATELKAMSDAQDESLKQIFGADAFEGAKRQNDATYQTLQQFAGVWNLSDSEVQQVYEGVHDFQQQADRLRSAAQFSEQAGQTVDWNAVNASIDKAQQQAEAGLQNVIGPDRLSRIEQNGLLAIR